jgi:hypothetical protein
VSACFLALAGANKFFTFCFVLLNKVSIVVRGRATGVEPVVVAAAVDDVVAIARGSMTLVGLLRRIVQITDKNNRRRLETFHSNLSNTLSTKHLSEIRFKKKQRN